MDNLAQIVGRIDVPVIVKEVGFGMSKETIKNLNEIGIRCRREADVVVRIL